MENLWEVGPVIRRLREERGWNQTELAAYSGTSFATISHIETGRRRPSARSLAKIAEALDVEVSELFPPKGSALRLPLTYKEGYADFRHHLHSLDLDALQQLATDLRADRADALAEGDHRKAAELLERVRIVGEHIEELDPPFAHITLTRAGPAQIRFFREPTDEELKRLEEQYPGFVITSTPAVTS